MRGLSRWFIVAMMTAISAVWLLPCAFTVLTAMKTRREFTFGSILDLPQQIALASNAAGAWQLADLGQGFINSVFYATVGSGGAVLCGSLAAYAIVHLRVRAGFALFMLMFVGTLFPFQMFLIPLYVAYTHLNLYNTHQGLLIFYTGIAIPFCLFVLRNFYTTIPAEVLEAATMDGCSRFRIYRSIVLPLSKAALSVLFLVQFVWIWNDLLFGLTLSQSSDIRPVMASLASLSGTYGTGSVPQVMAGALIVSLPEVVLFFLFRRSFMEGMRLTTAG